MSSISRLKRARRRLVEVTRPYLEDLADNWSEVAKRWEDVKAFYRSHEWFRSLIHGVAALMAVVALDLVSGHQVGFRFLFIVPVFVASVRGDWITSSLVTAATFVMLIVFDARYGVLEGESAALGVIVNFVALSATASFIVAMQRQIRRVNRLANYDALTGAMNRAAIQAYADSAIRKAQADGTRLVVGVIDCDGFKEINDVFGHAVGDDVLVMLVQTLQKYIGNHGALGRIGGDEFVMVVEDRSIAFVSRLIDRARQEYTAVTSGVTVTKGFSHGFAALGADGSSYGELVQVADSRMYSDKAVVEIVHQALKVC